MKTMNRTQSRLVSALLVLCMIMSILPLWALPVTAVEPAVQSFVNSVDPRRVVPLRITSGLNRDVIADEYDAWSSVESKEVFDVDSLEVNGEVSFAAAGLFEEEGSIGPIIESEATKGLYWRRADLSGNTAVQVNHEASAITFDVNSSLSSLYFLYATTRCTTPSTNKLRVTVNYTDSSSTTKDLTAPDWYGTSGTVATDDLKFIRNLKAGIPLFINAVPINQGSATGAPYLHQGEVLIDPGKTIKNVYVSRANGNEECRINILAVSGISDKYAAFDISSAANKDVVFDSLNDTFDLSETDSVDSTGRVFFSTELGKIWSLGVVAVTVPAGGFPANNVIPSEATKGLYYILNGYDRKNSIQLLDGETASVNAPVGVYDKLYFLYSTGNGGSNSRMKLKVNYKEGGYTESTVAARDWSSSSGTVAASGYANTAGTFTEGEEITKTGMYSKQNFVFSSTGSPYLHQAEIAVDSGKHISNIEVTCIGASNNTRLNVLGISAELNNKRTADGFYYSESGGKMTVTGYNGTSKYITVPSAINGKSVVSIGRYAFSGNASVEEVTIPLSVTKIEADAFNKCTSLTSVTVPGSVTEIGASAFEDCDSLVYVNLSEGLKTVGSAAFRYCDGLKRISIPNSVTGIASVAFRRCTSLEYVVLPKGLSGKLTNGTFDGCSSLKSIVIPEGVTVIGERVFQDCTSMTMAVIPQSVKEIQNIAFNNCIALKTVEYYGTKEEMEKITIDPNGNDKLKSALIPMRKSEGANDFIHMNAEDDFPVDTEAENGLNPLGQKKDTPFLIMEQNEFFLYRSYQATGGYVSRHEKYYFDPSKDLSYSEGQYFSGIEAPTGKVVPGFPTSDVEAPLKVQDGNVVSPLTLLTKPDMAYVEAVAYDPNGTGRRDHIAYVGIVGSGSDDGKVWIWVEDANGARVGWHNPNIRIDWMRSSEDLERYKAQNYMSITAGDYDGDGKETFVIYIPNYKDGNNVKPGAVHEYTMQNGHGSNASSSPTYSVKWLSSINVDNLTSYTNTKTENGKLVYRHDPASNMSDLRFEPQVSLASGDFDGDGKDELATSVSMGVCGDIRDGWTADGNNRTTLGNYVTTVNIIPKNKGATGFNTNAKYKKEMYSLNSVMNSDNTKTRGKYYGLYSGQLCAGDTTGSGKDDLVVVGYTGAFHMDVLKSDGSMENFYHLQDLDQNNFGYATIMFNDSTGEYTCSNIDTESYNQFTQTGTAMYFDEEDGVHTPLTVASAKMEGGNAPETFFICGSLYKLDSGKLQSVFTPNFFNRYFNRVDSDNVTNYFVDNVTAGNFDHDAGGREEFYFTYMFKNAGSEKYGGHTGIVGGVYGDDVTDGEVTAFGELTDYYSTRISENNLTFTDNVGRYVNLIPICVDTDKDGILGMYESTNYMYADPTVEAVLQAAPYFGELEEYGECGGETSYTITVGNTKGTTKGHSNSFSIMPVFGFSLGDNDVGFEAQFQVSAGYSLEHSSGFDDAYSTEYSTTFTAGPYDTVVVQRLPIQLYYYRIFDGERNAWSDGYYILQSIRKPVYYQYSVSEYNELVDIYNGELYNEVHDSGNSGLTDKLNKDGVNIKQMTKRELSDNIGMKKITTSDLPADTSGNPQNYWHTWALTGEGGKKLSDYTVGLGMNGGSTSVEWSQSEEHGYSYEIAHGFSFEASVMFSHNAWAAKITAGVQTSYNHSVSSGYYHSSSSGTSASGSVANLNLPGFEALGLSKDTVKAYGFNWEFGTWTRNLGSSKSDDDGMTPFFGYIVKDVTMPSSAVCDLEARYILNVDNNKLSADLRWSRPENIPGRAAVHGYNVYSIENGDYKLINQTPVTTLGYSVENLERSRDYTFAVTTVYTDFGGGESLRSNEAVLYAEDAPIVPMRTFNVVGANMTFTATGNKLGVSMDGRRGTCLDATSVSLTAKANPGYKIKGYQIGTADAVTLPENKDTYQMNVTVSADDLDIVFVTEYVGALTPTEGSSKISLDNVSGHAGQTVVMDVKLENNPGVAFVRFGLNYDRSVLELKSVSNGVLFTGMTSGAMQVFANSDNITEDGLLATLKFTIKNDTAPNTYDVGFSYCEAYDEDENTVAFTAIPGTVEVKSPLDIKHGDANGDGAINGRDSVLLLRYLANYADGVLVGDTEVVIASGADVTGDGAVNGKDATRLLSYLANYDSNGNLVEGGVEVKLGPAA